MATSKGNLAGAVAVAKIKDPKATNGSVDQVKPGFIIFLELMLNSMPLFLSFPTLAKTDPNPVDVVVLTLRKISFESLI